MLKLKTCFLISLFQVAANHGNEKPKQVPKIIVRSFKILFNAIYVYIYTACTETVHNFRKIVSIHNLYQHLLDLCQCNALNEKWLPDYLLLSNLLLLSSSYPKFSKKSKKKKFSFLVCHENSRELEKQRRWKFFGGQTRFLLHRNILRTRYLWA